MPAIRRGSTYLDVSTTPHTPEGRLKLNRLPAGRALPYKNAVCTALLFICDENRDLNPTETLNVSFEDFQTIMKSRARAADMKLGSYTHARLRLVLSGLMGYGHIELTSAYIGRQRHVVQGIIIRPSFRNLYQGFHEALYGCGTLPEHRKYRAYMSLATKVFGPNRMPTVLEVAKCAIEFSKQNDALLARSSLHGERDETSTANNQVDVVMNNDIIQDNGSMDSYQVVPVTPTRALSHNHSNREIGLPTPESLPLRRHAVVLPATSSASSSEVISYGNDDQSHSDRQNPQMPDSRSSYFGEAICFVSGLLQGFRWSCDLFIQEVSSLHTRVIDLQTSLTAAERALREANLVTSGSQQRCLDLLEDLQKARINIVDLETRAKGDAVEKDNLQQEVADLKAEVSRLQSGIEMIKQIAGGLIPL